MTLTSTESKTSRAIVEMYNLGYRANLEGKISSPYVNRLLSGCCVPDRGGYVYLRTPKSVRHLVGSIPLHRFIGYCKYGAAIFSPDVVIRHINGIKTDHRDENIVIGTHSQNSLDEPKEQRVHYATKASKCVPYHKRVVAARKHSKETIDNIRKSGESGKTALEIHRETGICRVTVFRVLRKEIYYIKGVDY